MESYELHSRRENMAMKIFSILILMLGGLLCAAGDVDILSDPQLHVVRVAIVRNENAGGSYHVATAKIEEVLKGASDLLGKTMEIPNSDKPFLGSTVRYVSQPLLKTGQVALIYVIERRNSFWGSGGLCPGDLMFPLIEGVHSEYGVMLDWFRERRDHPERQTPVPINAKKPQEVPIQSQSVPEVPVIQPPSGTSTTAGQPSLRIKEPERTADEDIGSWMSGTIAALVVLVLIWFLRRQFRKGIA